MRTRRNSSAGRERFALSPRDGGCSIDSSSYRKLLPLKFGALLAGGARWTCVSIGYPSATIAWVVEMGSLGPAAPSSVTEGTAGGSQSLCGANAPDSHAQFFR